MHQARMSTGRLTESAVLEQYEDLFDGSLGLLEDDVHLDTDPTVHPVQMPLRRLTVAVRLSSVLEVVLLLEEEDEGQSGS